MLKKLVLACLRFYKKRISPLLPDACIYTPTCSEYAFTAVSRFGIIKGGFLAIKRILRCNPFFKGGVDPVPDRKKDIKWVL